MLTYRESYSLKTSEGDVLVTGKDGNIPENKGVKGAWEIGLGKESLERSSTTELALLKTLPFQNSWKRATGIKSQLTFIDFSGAECMPKGVHPINTLIDMVGTIIIIF